MVRSKSSHVHDALELAGMADPSLLRTILRARGFEQRKPPESLFDVADVFAGPGGRRFIVPLDKRSPDFDRCVLQIAEELATPPVMPIDLLTSFAMQQCGMIKVRLADPTTRLGTVPVAMAVEAISGVQEMLRYSAAAIASETKPAIFTNVPDSAKVLVEECRLGQTELGSFVFKLFCPLNPLNLSRDVVGPPIGELALQTFLENARYLVTGAAKNSPRPQTLTRNFVDGFLKLRPSSEFGNVGLDIVTDTIAPVRKTLSAGPDVFQRAHIVGLEFGREDNAPTETVSGFVTDLHSEPPGSKDLNRSVGIRIRYGDGERTIRIALAGTDYTSAVDWHKAGREILLRCIFDKRRHQWTVARLLTMQPVGGVDPLLRK